MQPRDIIDTYEKFTTDPSISIMARVLMNGAIAMGPNDSGDVYKAFIQTNWSGILTSNEIQMVATYMKAIMQYRQSEFVIDIESDTDATA